MTDFALANLPGPVGSLQRARLYAPDGVTVIVDLALVESPAGTFGGTVTLAPTPADNPTTPYQYEVRQVATQDAAGFNASATETVSKGDFDYLIGGAWFDTPAVGGQVGFWTSQAQVEQEFGVDNCAQDVDLNDNGAGTAAVWQQALNWVDALIDRIFAQAGYARPTDLTSTDYVLVSGYAASMVRNEIHGGRGSTETNGAGGPATGGVYQRDADAAERALRLMAVRGVAFPKISTEAAVAPSSIAPTRDRYGFPVRTSTNPWPVMPWGYGWGYGGGW